MCPIELGHFVIKTQFAKKCAPLGFFVLTVYGVNV